MEIKDVTDYKLSVHRSLLATDTLFGIGTNAAIILMVVSIILMQIIGLWVIFVSLTAFFLLKILCKEDPYLVDILLNNITEQDVYNG